MAASQRVSRGFHRLALFLAAIPFLVGGAWSLTVALGEASNAKVRHEHLVCAQMKLKNTPAPAPARAGQPKEWSFEEFVGINLKQVGCSDYDHDNVTYEEARNPPAFNWLATFGSAMLPSMPITLALALAVYGIVRAIGWVIGGFAAT